MSGDDFFSRWSRRKVASRAAPSAVPAAPDAGVDVRASAGIQSAPSPDPPKEPQPPEPLPPVESLTTESDFTPFMRDEVDPGLRRQALRTLFRDPRFNVMDGLDTYIDDYSKPDPIPPDWLEKLNQVAYLGDYRPPEAAPEAQAEMVPHAGTEGNPTEEQMVAGNEPIPGPDTSVQGSPPPELKESDI
jgi:Protein of unknown function (DUF3306)